MWRSLALMDLPKIGLVLIGHKDHGKSTLAGRLLFDSGAIPEQKLKEVEAELKIAGDESFRYAFFLDMFEEERRNGLTIDVMQMPFRSKRYLYTIIDCPGHREFIKKMSTGASQADAAVLVVSAKEGIQEQTRQHAILAKTLGIRQLVVAINKMDLVGYAEEMFLEICNKLRTILGSIGYDDPPIVPVSALDGENVVRKSEKMRWHKGLSLIETLDENIVPSALPTGKALRACVQDTYRIGEKEVIVCKILTGALKAGDLVYFDPPGRRGTVVKIEGFENEAAGPGDSIGIVMDMEVGAARGQVISHPENRARVPRSLTAEVVIFSDKELKTGDTIRIRCGTAEANCTVQKLLEKIDPINLIASADPPSSLKNGDVGKLVLSPIEPICIEEYSEFPELGRFIIEDRIGTAAAGIVLRVETKKMR
jgi:elongation factor 1-alpha